MFRRPHFAHRGELQLQLELLTASYSSGGQRTLVTLDEAARNEGAGDGQQC
jgi:hypothetical protein